MARTSVNIVLIGLVALAAAAGVAAQTLSHGMAFRECPECPEMVVIGAGRFTMGVPPDEEERERLLVAVRGRSVPQHPVSVRQFAMSRFEVTRGEFATFVRETGHQAGSTCWTVGEDGWKERTGLNWQDPGFEQTDRHPVACVNWNDAKAYVGWLARKTGSPYRLPSEAEWEYAARAATQTSRFWGDGASAACGYANVSDQTQKNAGFTGRFFECSDGYVYSAPVGSFRANGFALYDMLGNVWEWVEDCWNDTYQGAPSDGQAWIAGYCSRRVARGGSWYDHPGIVRVGIRDGGSTLNRNSFLGFRVAKTL
jgi:formylglycine-generating enzyme required for sulfatase activity